MSGERRNKRAPIDFSQADIDALAAGRRPATVSRRLKAAPAPASGRAAAGGKQAPGMVKRADLPALGGGRASAAARRRLFRDSPPPADAAPPGQTAAEGAKAAPTQPPPRPARKRG